MEYPTNAFVPISRLEPSLDTSSSGIKGVVTLVWPYSASRRSISILLVEPDFRMRLEKGQVRITFKRACAKALARAGISSGDEIKLHLDGCRWLEETSSIQTPGKTVGWELGFDRQVNLEMKRANQDIKVIKIEKSNSPEPLRPFTPPQIRTPVDHASPVSPISIFSTTSTWSTSALRKRRKRGLSNSLASTQYDFLEDDNVSTESAAKRLRFTPKGKQWRIAGRSPSPEPKASQSPRSPRRKTVITADNSPKKPGPHGSNFSSQENPKVRKAVPLFSEALSNDNELSKKSLTRHEKNFDNLHQDENMDSSFESGQVTPSFPPDEHPARLLTFGSGFTKMSVPYSTPDLRTPYQLESSTGVLTSSSKLKRKEEPRPRSNVGSDSIDVPDKSRQAPQETSESIPRDTLPLSSGTISQSSLSNQVPTSETLQGGYSRADRGDRQDIVSFDFAKVHGNEFDPLPRVSDSVFDAAATGNVPGPAGAFPDLVTGPLALETPGLSDTFVGYDYSSQIPDDSTITFDMETIPGPQDPADFPPSPTHTPQLYTQPTSSYDRLDQGKLNEKNMLSPHRPITARSANQNDLYLALTRADAPSHDNSELTSASATNLENFLKIYNIEEVVASSSVVTEEETPPTGTGEFMPQKEGAMQLSQDESTWDYPEKPPSRQNEVIELSSDDDSDSEHQNAPKIAPQRDNEHMEQLGYDAIAVDEQENSFPMVEEADMRTDGIPEPALKDASRSSRGRLTDDTANKHWREEPIQVSQVAENSETIDAEVVEPFPSDVPRQPTGIEFTQMRERPAILEVDLDQDGPPPRSDTIQKTETQKNIKAHLGEQHEENAEIIPSQGLSSRNSQEKDPHSEAEKPDELLQESNSMGDGHASRSPQRDESIEPRDLSSAVTIFKKSHAGQRATESALVSEADLQRQDHASSGSIPLAVEHTQGRKLRSRGAAHQSDKVSEVKDRKAGIQVYRQSEDSNGKVARSTRGVKVAERMKAFRESGGLRDLVPEFAPATAEEEDKESSVSLKSKKAKTRSLRSQQRSKRNKALDRSNSSVGKNHEGNSRPPDRTATRRQKDNTKTTEISSTERSLPALQGARDPAGIQLLAEFDASATSLTELPLTQGVRTENAYFTPLTNLHQHVNNTIDALVIVIGCSAPEKASAGPRDWHLTLYVTDVSMGAAGGDFPMRAVQVFRRARSALPRTAALGDVMVLQNFKCVTRKRQTMLLSTESSGWIAFSSQTILNEDDAEPKISGPPVDSGSGELLIAQRMGRWWIHLDSDTKGTLEERTAKEIERLKEAARRRSGKKSVARPGEIIHVLRNGSQYPFTDTQLLSDDEISAPEMEGQDG